MQVVTGGGKLEKLSSCSCLNITQIKVIHVQCSIWIGNIIGVTRDLAETIESGPLCITDLFISALQDNRLGPTKIVPEGFGTNNHKMRGPSEIYFLDEGDSCSI